MLKNDDGARRRGAWAGGAIGPAAADHDEHPDLALLFDHLRNRLSLSDQRALLAHLGACADCRALVWELRGALATQRDTRRALDELQRGGSAIEHSSWVRWLGRLGAQVRPRTVPLHMGQAESPTWLEFGRLRVRVSLTPNRQWQVEAESSHAGDDNRLVRVALVAAEGHAGQHETVSVELRLKAIGNKLPFAWATIGSEQDYPALGRDCDVVAVLEPEEDT